MSCLQVIHAGHLSIMPFIRYIFSVWRSSKNLMINISTDPNFRDGIASVKSILKQFNLQ